MTDNHGRTRYQRFAVTGYQQLKVGRYYQGKGGGGQPEDGGAYTTEHEISQEQSVFHGIGIE